MKRKILIILLLIARAVYGQEIEYEGVYSYGTTAENGRIGVVYVYPNSENTLLFYLELNRGAPSYNSGAIVGQMNIYSPGKANFAMVKENDRIDCRMNFLFTKDSLYIRTNNNADNCGYGHAVCSEGDFKRIKKKVPDFFIDISGEETWFKDLNWEDWWDWE